MLITMQSTYSLLNVVVLGLTGLHVAVAQQSSATSSLSTARSFTASPNFPTALFSQYYYGPSFDRQPQPKIFDDVLNITYPLNLTDPTTIPTVDEDPYYLPQPVGQFTNGSAIISAAQGQIQQILASNATNCTKCIQALELGHQLALQIPQSVPDLLVELCSATGFKSNASCVENYAASNFGAIWTQILAYGNMSGSDGQYVCHSLSSSFCPAPRTLPSNTTSYFGAKPKNVTVPQASGKRVKVLHLSDMHLDPRFAVGSEGNCTGYLCCRLPTEDSSASTNISEPATLYGNFQCDSPYFLLTAALQSIPSLTGTTLNYTNSSLTDHFAWTVYSGDLVSHDNQNQLSRAYTEYTEYSLYHVLKYFIPGGPVFAALGNHDTNPEAIDSPHSLPGNLGQQQSWNFEHVAGLWEHNSWITRNASNQARMHYGAYSINHPKYPRLRIITLNTDFWYRSNYLNFINTTDPDVSGNLKFLANELLAAEANSERVWIIGHVLTGWDGTNPLPNPTDLFYQILDRFSPHVIANVFFGHTHEDQFMIYYANNGTVRDAAHALTTGWIGPSLTPLTNLNSGYRMYEVDTGDFNIYNAYTYFANVSSFNKINTNTSGPVFQLEYSTREAYPIPANLSTNYTSFSSLSSSSAANMSMMMNTSMSSVWPQTAPLNATYWHLVTEAMSQNRSLISLQNTYQGKRSVRSPNCTSDACAAAKVCYMRSGSVALGQSCPQGFGSVQSKFTGKNY